MVYFKENYNFLRFQRGSNIFQGRAVQFFLGGGVWTPYPPSGSAHAYDRTTFQVFSKANPEGQVFSCNGSFSIVRATSDNSKHDEVHDSAIFYLVLH